VLKARIVVLEETTVARFRHSKHLSAAINAHVTVEELQCSFFCMNHAKAM
jgi:hypothetical protein